ncbi:unnamed protein product [Staurois parvus]|uniref:Uncharacterized protein n=1 Tax=Staurois parvus TaxID=386267 RepID=A0ABN9CD07_9NEOB|nr:unnamed protein product [Staurois parvus]
MPCSISKKHAAESQQVRHLIVPPPNEYLGGRRAINLES